MTVETRLESHAIETLEDVQAMRVIRNAGRFSFSTDQDEISEEAQCLWWTAMQGRVHAWLYRADGTVVAFGMIRRGDDGRWSPSVGVLAEHQGHRYGGQIVDDLADQARRLHIELHAQARLSNPAAVATHHAKHWHALGTDETYAYFRSKP